MPTASTRTLYTRIATTDRQRFVALYPLHAAVAREAIRSRPDCHELRFCDGASFAIPGGEVERIQAIRITLRSATRVVIVEVAGEMGDGDGTVEPLTATVILDREAWP
jgi:hypothetical protein